MAIDEHKNLDTQEELEKLLVAAKPLFVRLENMLEEGRTASARTRTSLEAAVRDRPLTALALAVAGGFILGSLRRR